MTELMIVERTKLEAAVAELEGAIDRWKQEEADWRPEECEPKAKLEWYKTTHTARYIVQLRQHAEAP